jgi:NAD(P)H-dependent flavin oxidoreductase YrpB (nitropropane dioxygenase family)
MNVPAMDPPQLTYYAGLCGWALARAHARTGRAAMIAGYLGSSDRFDRAIEEFAIGYANQNEHDYQRLLNAIERRQLTAIEGI